MVFVGESESERFVISEAKDWSAGVYIVKSNDMVRKAVNW
jgi:hypothetical protein